MARAKKKTKILLIEDDAFLAEVYSTKFDLEGLTCDLATTGEKGLELARKELPDLILLDILLPSLDGFAVLKALKKDHKTRDIPVVLLTNLSQKEDIREGLKLGAVDYLIKAHFMPAEVIAKIKNVLNNHHVANN
jgi:DNA-binding response OmpR family regulator